MTRIPDDKSLVFLPLDAAALLDASGGPLPRLREFVATRGNRVAFFDPRRLREVDTHRDLATVIPALVSAYGWHAPHVPPYSWEGLHHGGPVPPAPEGEVLGALSESLLLRWLDAAAVTASLVFVVSAHGAEGVFTRGSRRITFVPVERFRA